MARILKSFLLCIVAYFIQACIMPLLPVFDVSANFLIVVMSIIIVGMGRQHGFVASLIFAILMETMLPNLKYFNLLIYPSISIIGLRFFADKTDRRMELERSLNKRYSGNRNPLLRTIFCTLVFSIVYELVNIAYIYLRGYEFSSKRYFAALIFVIYNLVLCTFVMVPIRKYYGLRYNFKASLMRKKKKTLDEFDPSKGISPVVPNRKKPSILEQELKKSNKE